MENEGIFHSEKMKEIYKVAKKYGAFDTTVLIEGETGTGKEVIAKIVHKYSSRANMPLLTINCGAISESLLDSELFGYVSGAFTGADPKGNKGIFESANNGTLLLDEIGELTPLLQVKLLRVLQEQEVRRIGGSWSKPVDVRIIACTNANIDDLVKEGKFRKDLFFRLGVAIITIPPLRERRADILPLLDYFLHEFCNTYYMAKVFDEDALYLLINHCYYGNVRELRNIVESSYITAESEVISVDDLPKYIVQNMPSGFNTSKDARCMQSLKEMLNDCEKEIITNALSCSGSIRKAALKLGISHSTLLRKIKLYNLEENNDYKYINTLYEEKV